ncbi:MAG TPA: hypothetical protein VFS92_05530, partial [Planctomycetota bacterium]|nr:hypothetical protein [Planctomycetota bacterium]
GKRPGSSAGGGTMHNAAKAGLAAGVAALAAAGVFLWRSRAEAPAAPPGAAPAAPVRDPSPRTTVTDAAPVPESPAPAAVPAAAAEEPGLTGPSIEERLDEKSEELRWEGQSVGTILEDLSRRLRLEPMPEYESEALRQAAYAASMESIGFGTLEYRVMLDYFMGCVRSPVEGKVLKWEVRKERLFVSLRDPPPPKTESPEEIAKREENAKAFLEFLRTEKTSFTFDGQPLEPALGYLSARHRINVMTDEAVRERVSTLTVKLSLRDATLAEAFDELLRLDPDLTWEVKGHRREAKYSFVIVRKR